MSELPSEDGFEHAKTAGGNRGLETVAGRRVGRPRRMPVSTVPLTDVQAFWRLKDLRLDSYQATRVVAFCALWQRYRGQMKLVVVSADYGRRTAFNRLRACRAAGFEPELVQFRAGTVDDWAAHDRGAIRDNELWFREELERYARLPLPLRLIRAKPQPYWDPMEED
jgi:hypothetical protein